MPALLQLPSTCNAGLHHVQAPFTTAQLGTAAGREGLDAEALGGTELSEWPRLYAYRRRIWGRHLVSTRGDTARRGSCGSMPYGQCWMSHGGP